MRLWIIILMVAAALVSPLFRSSIRLPRSIQTVISPTSYKSLNPFAQPYSSQTTTTITAPQSQTAEATMAAAAAADSAGLPQHETVRTDKTTTVSPQPPKDPELPKLSAADFRVYNRLAVMMDAYHNHFRHTWNMLYQVCTTQSRPAGLSIRSFLTQGLHLCHSLTVHHTIEEQHIFPELAERMPAFGAQDHLIRQHEEIHEGLEKMEAYLGECRSGVRELRLEELKAIMDGFGTVLWSHLDDEVRMLGAESMRRHWTKEEILRMNW